VKQASHAPPVVDLASLEDSWVVSLEARNLSVNTITVYLAGFRRFLSYAHDHGMPTAPTAITREHIEAFQADLLRDGAAPKTARAYYQGLRSFFTWALEEGEVQAHPMERMRPPSVSEVPIPVLSDDELRALLRSCDGTGFEDRRDQAILRVFITAGLRLGELTGLQLPDDVDLHDRVLHVMGKGRIPRTVAMGPRATQSLDRYIRIRRAHRHADRPELWLGVRGPMTTSGIRQMLERRGDSVGVKVNPHQIRHTWAHRWLARGHQEEDLRRLAGWRSRQMLSRYAASAAQERAIAAHRRFAAEDDL
jgi:site-specific recombinase XerD